MYNTFLAFTQNYSAGARRAWLANHDETTTKTNRIGNIRKGGNSYPRFTLQIEIDLKPHFDDDGHAVCSRNSQFFRRRIFFF